MAGDPDKKSRDPKAAQDVIQKSSNVNVEKAAMGALDIDAKITVYVILACVVAASGGVLFGELLPCCSQQAHSAGHAAHRIQRRIMLLGY